MLGSMVPAVVMEVVRQLTPVLGRGIVRAVRSSSRHLPAPVASATASVPSLLVTDHVRPDAWAASEVRIGLVVGDFLFPLSLAPFLLASVVMATKQGVAVVVISTAPNARPKLLRTLSQLTRRDAA